MSHPCWALRHFCIKNCLISIQLFQSLTTQSTFFASLQAFFKAYLPPGGGNLIANAVRDLRQVSHTLNTVRARFFCFLCEQCSRF